MMDGDLGRHIRIRIIGNVLAQRVRQLDLPRLNQLKYRNRREHLVHRTDAKPRVEFVYDVLLAIGQPVRSAEQHLAAFGQDYSSRKAVRRSVLLEFVAQRADDLGLAHPGCREFGGSWNGVNRKTCDSM